MANTLYYTSDECVEETSGSENYTPFFGKMSYEKHTWLTGEYDPHNAYPLDERGKAYVKSVETLGDRGVWFIMRFHNKERDPSAVFFVDNYGNVWAQRKDLSGKRICPIKEKTYKHSTIPLTDYDIYDVRRRWQLPDDETKVTEYIWRCVALAEAESKFGVTSSYMKKLEGVQLLRKEWVALYNRYIVANAGGYVVDNYGQVGAGPRNEAEYPLLEIQRPALECLLACGTTGIHEISKILQDQAKELYALELGVSTYNVIPPLEGESFPLKRDRYLVAKWARGPIDNHGQAYIKGTMTIVGGTPGSFQFQGDHLNPCDGTFDYPMPTLLQPVLDYVIKYQKTALCLGHPSDIGYQTPDMTLCGKLEKLQPLAKWLYTTYAPSSLKRDIETRTRTRDQEDALKVEEEMRRVEAELAKKREEEQRVLDEAATAEATRIATERAKQREAVEAELLELERAVASMKARCDTLRATSASLL